MPDPYAALVRQGAKVKLITRDGVRDFSQIKDDSEEANPFLAFCAEALNALATEIKEQRKLIATMMDVQAAHVPAPAQVIVQQPRETVETIERDANNEIARITRTTKE